MTVQLSIDQYDDWSQLQTPMDGQRPAFIETVNDSTRTHVFTEGNRFFNQ